MSRDISFRVILTGDLSTFLSGVKHDLLGDDGMTWSHKFDEAREYYSDLLDNKAKLSKVRISYNNGGCYSYNIDRILPPETKKKYSSCIIGLVLEELLVRKDRELTTMVFNAEGSDISIDGNVSIKLFEYTRRVEGDELEVVGLDYHDVDSKIKALENSFPDYRVKTLIGVC